MPYKNPEKRRAYMQAYDKARMPDKIAKKRERRDALMKEFVAIDSEGFSYGTPILKDEKTYQPHRTFLWGAGDKEGHTDFLYEPRALGTVEIVEWLLSLPTLFPDAIFVAFAFSYDATQILADLPFEKALDIQRGKDENGTANHKTFWGDYGFFYLKGKEFRVEKYPAGEGPYKRNADGSLRLTLKGKKKSNAIKKIRIYDVFGFFQKSFVKAIGDFPGAASDDEFKLIKSGKKERANFEVGDIEFVKSYTSAELVCLARMMEMLRDALKAQNLRLKNWYGAGSIAAAMMKQEKVKDHYPPLKSEGADEFQMAAHRAYFGGRIELVKQGFTRKVLHGYDIASAYPFISTLLPSMRGGTFDNIHGPSHAQIQSASIVSMVRVRTRNLPPAPFYPLPYRSRSGAIYFPRETYGWYMRDEALAAAEWVQKLGGEIEFEVLYRFNPADPHKPFDFLQRWFDYRKSLKKSDIRQLVIKLGINATYGKTAETVGNVGKVPTLANPFYAAAITAGTRAKLLRAALLDPGAVVMMATDGIIATRPLPLEIPREKLLGAWEYGKSAYGGVFVLSGVYALHHDIGDIETKSRGVRPTNLQGPLSDVLLGEIPEFWRNGTREFEYPYSQYMTLGAAVSSRDNWEHVGQWVSGKRQMDIQRAGNKRMPLRRRKTDRAHTLVTTEPYSDDLFHEFHDSETGEILMSLPHTPEWLSPEMGIQRANEIDYKNIAARFAEE